MLPRWGLLHAGEAGKFDDGVDWAKFAYSTYATSESDLCHSVMLLESLHRLKAKAQKLLLHPREWDDDKTEGSVTSNFLRAARERYHAHLQPIDAIRFPDVSDSTWAAGFTKLLGFNQTQYKRLLMLDSDGTILQPMGDLFLMPPSPVAMPHAYWLGDPTTFNAQCILVQPSTSTWGEITEQLRTRKASDYDMEVVNDLYANRSAVIPHRSNVLLSGEFRSNNHTAYLTKDNATWNADAVIDEARYVHFSDWPMPKPWIRDLEGKRDEVQPQCRREDGSTATDCAERRIWHWLYDDFQARRKRICNMDMQ